MILIADSGSTKCTWALCRKKEGKVQYFYTIGFNPFFVDKEKMVEHLQKSELNNFTNDITEVYFYGAGCSNEQMKEKLKQGLMLMWL